jgi:ubiquinone/menaquinone biosynthesis C-methylase UbiE
MLEKEESTMHEKRFEGDIERLRSPERVNMLEVERVVHLCLNGKRSGSILDVGTGTGLFAEAFAKHGMEVSGVDANPEMLITARKFVPQGDFRTGSAEALPYPDASFDNVFLGLVLHESDEPLLVLKEARRVAKQEVSILEWAHRTEEFGPPLAHRLKSVQLMEMVKQAGFSHHETFPLLKLMLYRLKI